MIARAQIKRLRDPREFVLLRGLERFVRIVEDRARIHQRGVEEEPVEIVAEIVMECDVLAAVVRIVGATGATQAVAQAGQGGEQSAVAIDPIEIAHRETRDGNEIGRRPFAGNVGIAEADVAAPENAAKKTIVVHGERGLHIVRWIAEAMRLSATRNFERTFAALLQAA
jgi:hypothetical protein